MPVASLAPNTLCRRTVLDPKGSVTQVGRNLSCLYRTTNRDQRLANATIREVHPNTKEETRK